MNTFAQRRRDDGGRKAAQTRAWEDGAAQLHDASPAHMTPHVESQLRLGRLLSGGPRVAEQTRLAQAVSGVAQRRTAQRQEADEEELVQRQETVEEELVQRQGAEEEELVQREEAPVEEEEAAQFQAATDEEELLQRQAAPEWEEEMPAAPAQRQAAEDEEPLQPKAEEGAQGRGGLPGGLQAGLESMSGVSLGDVKVHYNSPEPSRLHALAYTQGSEIHVGPGQEKHLAHEAWHAVQQKQGRVRATTQMRGVSVNDDESLEREADVMGAKALQMKPAPLSATGPAPQVAGSSAQTRGPIQMLREVTLPEQDYGLGHSKEAMEKRMEDNISPKQNIATFHFVPRPPLEGEGESAEEGFPITESSTGIGTYVTVSERTKAEKRINLSHSEHQIISGQLETMHKEENFPQKNVIDWVYTERPACPDVWYGQKFIAKGCHTELKEIEDMQKLRLWDVGEEPNLSPYALRPDLEITVYSTFESSAEISKAAFFAPIRTKVYWALARKLDQMTGDTDQALKLADELPSWTDYDLSLSEKSKKVFHEALVKEARGILYAQSSLEIRHDVYLALVNRLNELYERCYETAGSEEEYDLPQYEGLYEQAKEVADELPYWTDYELSPDQNGLKQFRNLLLEAADDIFAKEVSKGEVVEEEEEVEEEEYPEEIEEEEYPEEIEEEEYSPMLQ